MAQPAHRVFPHRLISAVALAGATFTVQAEFWSERWLTQRLAVSMTSPAEESDTRPVMGFLPALGAATALPQSSRDFWSGQRFGNWHLAGGFGIEETTSERPLAVWRGLGGGYTYTASPSLSLSFDALASRLGTGYAIRSGMLPSYATGGEVSDFGLHLSARYTISRQWSLRGLVGYHHLFDAEDNTGLGEAVGSARFLGGVSTQYDF